MNPELKKKWVDALRSGEYCQGRAYLKQGDWFGEKVTHCCLGVLCEVAAANEYPNIKIYDNMISAGGSTRSLPKEVADMFGLPDGTVQDLISANDTYNPRTKKNFNEIADWIEENL